MEVSAESELLNEGIFSFFQANQYLKDYLVSIQKREKEAILIDCHKQEVIDGRICNVALRLLTKPVDSNLPPGITGGRDSSGLLRYIVEKLPDATTEEMHYELANYHKTMMSVVKDF